MEPLLAKFGEYHQNFILAIVQHEKQEGVEPLLKLKLAQEIILENQTIVDYFNQKRVISQAIALLDQYLQIFRRAKFSLLHSVDQSSSLVSHISHVSQLTNQLSKSILLVIFLAVHIDLAQFSVVFDCLVALRAPTCHLVDARRIHFSHLVELKYNFVVLISFGNCLFFRSRIGLSLTC